MSVKQRTTDTDKPFIEQSDTLTSLMDLVLKSYSKGLTFNLDHSNYKAIRISDLCVSSQAMTALFFTSGTILF